MDNEQRLLLMREEARRYLIISERILREITPDSLIRDLESWLKKRRFIDPAIFISRALFTLEGRLFGEEELGIAAIAGAAAAISDDLVDNKTEIPYERIELLQRHDTRKEDLLGLFDTFNHTLLDNLPATFQDKYKRIIFKYNEAQRDSAKLFEKSITIKEIKDIKNRAGGYSILLLHAMMFARDFEKGGMPYSETQRRKFLTLYSFGALLSKIDDLWDEDKDRKRGIKQLATEGIITWQKLNEETERIKVRLKKHFQAERVDDMFEQHYTYLTDEDLFRKYGVQKRIC